MKVNKFLQRYEEELADLSAHFRIDFHKQVDTIHNFVEDFVDSLITDWIIKRKIDNAMHLAVLYPTKNEHYRLSLLRSSGGEED